MPSYLRIFLPVYLFLFFGVAFIAKSVLVARRIGKSPLVLPRDDSAYGLVGRYFKWTMGGLMLYTLIFGLFPSFYPVFLPIDALQRPEWQYSGLTLLMLALVWTVVAQYHMRDSWRIGIDEATRTELITEGLFGVSRNPIFLGMLLSLLGLFLLTPNALCLLFLILGYVLIQIQVRLEEDFLTKTHGEAYRKYCAKVRRYI